MPNDRSAITLKVLVGLVIFNVIGIGLSEVQRWKLARSSLEQFTISTDAIAFLTKQLAVVTAELRAQRGQDRPVDWDGERSAAAVLLNAKATLLVRFDDSVNELKGADSRVLCGPEAQNSYLGIFVAGEIYKVSFDKSAQRWRGTGPSQMFGYDPITKTCSPLTMELGPADTQGAIKPESEKLVIWGAVFQVDGKALKLGGAKVGELIGFE